MREIEELILLRDIYDRQVTEDEAANLIAVITQRTRRHPEINRGVSVRGAIALNQVSEGFGTLEDGLVLSGIEKAAMITLPPRIEVKQDSGYSAEEIIQSIVLDVLYGEGGPETKKNPEEKSKPRKLSFDEFLAALQDLSLSKTLGEREFDDGDGPGNYQVVSQDGKTAGASSRQDLEKDNRYKDWAKWYPELEKALKDMIGELEQKLVDGEISESEFRYQKKKLEDMLNAGSYLDSGVSEDEIAGTIMEMMEAGDRQWQKDLDFRDMYMYYHIKESRSNDGLSVPKKNWYALKVIVDYLENADILDTGESGSGIRLTEKAIEMMLKKIGFGPAKQGTTKSNTYTINKSGTERRQDTRRFVSGDVFRDISLRRSLREIARRRRQPHEINRHDLKVFLKEFKDPKSDVMLCLDSSGSMGFHGKLITARLTAAALAKNALHNGDRVGVVTFDDLGRSELSPTDRESEILRHITGVSSGGNTNIGDGLKQAITLLQRERNRNRKVIILITDAEPTAISEEALSRMEQSDKKDMTGEYAIAEARKALIAGIETNVVHVTDGKSTGKDLAERIAKAGHGNVKQVARPEDIRSFML